MQTEYLSDARWDQLQQAIASALLPACDAGDADAQERATSRAALMLAELYIMWEGDRAADPDPGYMEICLNGLNVRTNIAVDMRSPLDMIEARARLCANEMVKAYMGRVRTDKEASA